MHVRVAVIGNGIGQVQRLNYLSGIQRRIGQGRGIAETVFTDVLSISISGRTVSSNINNDLTSRKGHKADLERVISYFRNVLEPVIPRLDAGRPPKSVIVRSI